MIANRYYRATVSAQDSRTSDAYGRAYNITVPFIGRPHEAQARSDLRELKRLLYGDTFELFS